MRLVGRAGVPSDFARCVASRMGPVWLSFCASLVLSAIASIAMVAVGRDGAFYLTIAQQVVEHGPLLAWAQFDWPWYSLLLAGTHAVSRLPLELCAALWSALFIAGTCALMVDLVRQRVPSAAWWACLVVLGMPAVNQFRGEVIREAGYWFFCTLAIWLAMRWQTRKGGGLAAAIHGAVALAALFRFEAVLVVFALVLWRLPDLFTRERRLYFLQMLWVPALAGVAGSIAVAALGGLDVHRWNYYLELVRPSAMFAAYHQLAQQFAASLINKYSVDDAGRIIFIGLAGALLIKCVGLMGPFSLPFLTRRAWRALVVFWREYKIAAITGAVYACVLMMFFIRLQFINGRYLSFLNLMLVPLLAVAAASFNQRYPRWGRVLVCLGLVVMLANVISFGAKKTHYVEAGHWVAEHTSPGASIYYEEGRVAYYAGRGYRMNDTPRQVAMADAQAGLYEYFVIEAKRNEPSLQPWLASHGQRILASFANSKGDTMLIIGR